MSADLLRKAATILRERIGQPNDLDDGEAFVIPGPWDVSADSRRRRFDVVPGSDDYDRIAFTEYEQEARYIATMHPGVGLALADWLDRIDEEQGGEFLSLLHPANVIARLIVGEQS